MTSSEVVVVGFQGRVKIKVWSGAHGVERVP